MIATDMILVTFFVVLLKSDLDVHQIHLRGKGLLNI